MQNPVIVVPGIQASGLEDFYPIPSEERWSAIQHKEFERIALHPDNVLLRGRRAGAGPADWGRFRSPTRT